MFLLYCLLLVVATVATYYPAASHPFLQFDDDRYVTTNAHVQDGLSGATIAWAFTTYYASNWHPLTWLSHALDYQMFGLDPGGPHEVNILLHVVNVLLLFWVLERATGRLGASAMVAALLALHPINVETVAWIAERKNLLSMMFLLLVLAAYRWYARQPNAGRYVLVGVLFLLGLMAKPQIVTLPFLLLLWDYWPLRRMELHPALEQKGPRLTAAYAERYPERNLQQLVVEKLPLFGLSAISAIVTVKAQQAGHAVQSLSKYPLSLRVENALVSYARYFAKAFWPTPLAALYPFPRSSPPAWQLLAALAVLLAVSGLVVGLRTRRYLTVGWLWFLGTLVPMIGLVQVGLQSMADRYAYLSFIGLFVMVCWGVADIVEARQVPRAWVIGAGVALLLVLASLTRHQLMFWEDEVNLWSHAIATTSGNYVAEDNLGTALLARSDTEEAIMHFRRANEIDRRDGLSELNIGIYEERKHHWPEAIAAYQAGISEIDEVEILARAYSNLGYVYLYTNDDAGARDTFQHAVELAPDTDKAWIGLGVVAQRSGDQTSAIRYYNRANHVQPSGLAYLLLARALHRSGRSEEAEAMLQTARRAPGNFTATQSMADGLVGR
jgi:tetratricopeptide (TPR) repeat protein